MPLLVALDEYDSALQSIAVHARLGLESPGYQESALRLILAVCKKTDETVEDALMYMSSICQSGIDLDFMAENFDEKNRI